MTSLKELQWVMVLLGVNIRIGPKVKYDKVYDQSDLFGTSMKTVKDEVEDTDENWEVFGHNDGDTPTKHQKNKKPSLAKKSSAGVKFKQCGLFKDFKVNMVRYHSYEGNNNEEEGHNLSENEIYSNKCNISRDFPSLRRHYREKQGIEDQMQPNDRHEPSENKHRKDSKELKYQCKDCNLMYSGKENLQNHMCDKHIAVEGEDKYQCKDCDLKFTTRRNLKRHRLSHSADGKFNCDKCTKTFRDRCSLKIHKERVHEGITYGCSGCKQIIAYKSDMIRHCRKTGHDSSMIYRIIP